MVKHEFDKDIAKAYNLISQIYLSQSKSEAALDTSRTAYAIQCKLNDESGQIQSLETISQVYTFMDRPLKALEC